MRAHGQIIVAQPGPRITTGHVFAETPRCRFALRGRAQYPIQIAETAVIRAWPLGMQKADDRRNGGIFSSVRLRAPISYGGPWLRGHLRVCRFPFAPVGQPQSLAPATPILADRRQASYPAKGGRNMRQSTHAHAHTGHQSQIIRSIVRVALRAAATAETYQDALDATGAALVAIAKLSRAEACHAE